MPVTPYVPQTRSHDAIDGALSRASRSRSAATTPECQTKTPQTVATAANTVNPVRTQSTGPTRPTSLRITTTPPSGDATKRHPDKQPLHGPPIGQTIPARRRPPHPAPSGESNPAEGASPGTTTRNLPPHSLDQPIHEALSPADVHRPRHRLPLPSNHQHTPLRPTIHPEPRPTSALPAIDLHIGDTPRPIRLHTITIPELRLPRSPHDPSRHLTLEPPHRLPQSPPMSRTLETLHTEVPVHDPAQRQQAPNPRIRQRLHIAVQTLEPHSPRRTRPIPAAHEPQILRRSLNPPRTRPRLGKPHDNHSLPETPHGTIPAAGPAQGNDPWNRQHGARRSAPVKHALGRSRKMLHTILTRGQHLVHNVPDCPGDVEPIHQRSPPRSAAATAAAQRSVSVGSSQQYLPRSSTSNRPSTIASRSKSAHHSPSADRTSSIASLRVSKQRMIFTFQITPWVKADPRPVGYRRLWRAMSCGVR